MTRRVNQPCGSFRCPSWEQPTPKRKRTLGWLVEFVARQNQPRRQGANKNVGLPVRSALTTEYRSRKIFYASAYVHLADANCTTLRRCFRITASLDCGGSTPSSSRHPAPVKRRYPPHLDTPSLKRSRAIYQRDKIHGAKCG